MLSKVATLDLVDVNLFQCSLHDSRVLKKRDRRPKPLEIMLHTSAFSIGEHIMKVSGGSGRRSDLMGDTFPMLDVSSASLGRQCR